MRTFTAALALTLLVAVSAADAAETHKHHSGHHAAQTEQKSPAGHKSPAGQTAKSMSKEKAPATR